MKEVPDMKGYYEIDIWLTHLFHQIYGESEYYQFKGVSTLAEHKKQFDKLLITIKKVFSESCGGTDKYHFLEINELIENQNSELKEKKSVEELYQSLIVFFPQLCFLIIGHIPQNLSEDKLDNRSKWNLNKYRQINYSQTRAQKSILVIDLLRNEKIKELDTYNVEMEKFRSHRLKGESFINWFIRNYPLIYINLFDKTE